MITLGTTLVFVPTKYLLVYLKKSYFYWVNCAWLQSLCIVHIQRMFERRKNYKFWTITTFSSSCWFSSWWFLYQQFKNKHHIHVWVDTSRQPNSKALLQSKPHKAKQRNENTTHKKPDKHGMLPPATTAVFMPLYTYYYYLFFFFLRRQEFASDCVVEANFWKGYFGETFSKEL